jgi:signal peptidase II
LTSRAPLRTAAAGAIIAILAIVVLAADQFAKYLAIENLPPEQGVPIIGEALVFYLIRNPGAAFSLGEGVTWIFTIALAVVAGVIVWLITRVKSRLWALVLGLLLGGVLGNLTDRLFREPGFPVGHVVDFISTPWMMPAIYNIADIFIVGGMISVALLVLLGVHMDGSPRGHKNDEETILGEAGDEFPPGGGVAGGFDSEFPVADPQAGVPADERGLPPLSEREQEAVEREADRIADDEARRDR